MAKTKRKIAKGKVRRTRKPAPKVSKKSGTPGTGEADRMGKELSQLIAKIGRPYELVETPELVARIFLMGCQHCTQEEAAARLGVHRHTFRDFLARNPISRDAWELGPPAGRASLRGKQYALAMSGHPNMLRWLGIQLLDQRTKFDGRLGLPGQGAGKVIDLEAEELTTKDLADMYARQIHGHG